MLEPDSRNKTLPEPAKFMAKILLIDDDRDLTIMVAQWLKFQHHLVEVVNTGNEAAELLKVCEYDIIVLDWHLPGIEGVEICRQFRQNGGQTPIIMLTGKKEIKDKETGFQTGADDYLTKPFDVRELNLRIDSLLRRPTMIRSSAPELNVRDIVINPATFRVLRAGQDVMLKPKEFALLEFFMRNPDQAFSVEALMQRVWESTTEASPDTVRQTIKRLRDKLEVKGQPPYIRTLHSVGYRLESQPDSD